MPNTYDHLEPADKFTWTAPPASNGHHPTGPAKGGDVEVDTGSVLLFAQRVADDTIADAKREAECILEEARAARAVPVPSAPAAPPADEMRKHAEQLRVESRLRNLLMNDLVECVAELSARVEREITEATDMLERARDRALADFSAINALARLAGLPAAPPTTEPDREALPQGSVADVPEVVPAADPFVVDLREAIDDDRQDGTPDDFDALFASRGIFMESREARRSRSRRSNGLFSTVRGFRAGE